MEMYILKSAACLLILFSFYKLFLEKENMHLFKRYYLLGSIVVSFAIPWITFTSYIEASPKLINSFIAENPTVIASEVEAATSYLPTVLWTIYSIGVLFFSFRFIRNLSDLILKIKGNPKLKINRITNVLLLNEVTPHTFFSFIFLNKKRFEANEIPSEVLIHEQTHAIQKHSLDVLLIELIQIIFWFNPLVYLIKHAIKLNHEFLADQAVLKKGIVPSTYQNLLLAFSSNATPQLANSINYSSIKKRFTVMKTETSKRSVLIRSLVLLPLVAILVFGFSSKETIMKERAMATFQSGIEKVKEDQIQKYNKIAAFWNERFAVPNADRKMPLSELQKLESIYHKMSTDQKANAEPFPACSPPKATPDQIAEYNKLAKKYNEMSSENMFILKKDVERLKYLYNLMTAAQREKAEPFPNFPPPPPAPDAPKATEAPRVIKGVNNMGSNIPPPPPSPDAPQPAPDPANYIKTMAKKGATFYLGKKKISAEEAIDIVRKSDNIFFQVEDADSKNPIVKLGGC